MPQYFATCPRGIETLLTEELAGLGAKGITATGGGVAFSGDAQVMMRANLESRLATRIMLRVAEAPYSKEDDIYRLAKSVRWTDWFGPDDTLRVDVTAVRSPLKSLEFTTLRIKDGVCDRFREVTGARPSIDTREPDMRVFAYLTEQQAQLYLDTSGAPLYQRGLRQKTVSAPLKENLAAGLLGLTGWQPGDALLDPMCGSGTFVLEAAQRLAGIAPGLRRSFAFQQFRQHDPIAWEACRRAAVDLQKNAPPAAPTLFASDNDPVAYRATLANLDRAGLLPYVQLTQADIREIAAPAASGTLLCNPPYGVRLAEQDELAAFYPELGRVFKQQFAGWSCFVLTADLRAPKLVGLKPSRKTPVFNGDLDCRLFRFDMVAGSHRRKPAEAG